MRLIAPTIPGRIAPGLYSSASKPIVPRVMRMNAMLGSLNAFNASSRQPIGISFSRAPPPFVPGPRGGGGPGKGSTPPPQRGPPAARRHVDNHRDWGRRDVLDDQPHGGIEPARRVQAKDDSRGPRLLGIRQDPIEVFGGDRIDYALIGPHVHGSWCTVFRLSKPGP